MCLLVTCTCSLEKCLLDRPLIFNLSCLFVCLFLIRICMSCLYILETNPLSIRLQIFSLILWIFFVLFMISFAMQKLLGLFIFVFFCLFRFHLFIFVFIFITLGGRPRKDSIVIYVKDCSAYVTL